MTLGWDYAGISSAQHERSSDGVGRAFLQLAAMEPCCRQWAFQTRHTVMWATQAGARAVANVSESAAATGVVCSASEDLSLTGSAQIWVAFRSFCHARTLRCISSVHEHVPLYPPLTAPPQEIIFIILIIFIIFPPSPPARIPYLNT